MWYLDEDEEQPSSDQAIKQLDSLRKREDEELADNQFSNKVPEPKPSTITEATMDARSEDAIRGYLSSLPPLEANSFSNNNNGAMVDPTGRDSVGMDIDSPQLPRHKSYDEGGEGDFQFNFELEGGSERRGFAPPRTNNNNNNEGPASPTEAFIEFRDEYRADKFLISDFLENATVYDAMPLSGKMVVLDTNLTVKAGFQALVENDIKSAPLWDSEIYDYVGMITVTDFIDVLRYFYRTDTSTRQHRIEQTPIKAWREILAQERPPSLIHLKPEDSIFKAGKTLLKFQIHRLPVIDREEQNTILYIITHTRIIKFLMGNLPQKPAILSCSIEKLGLGTRKHVVSAKESTSLISVLNLLSERKISAVPVVDEQDRLVEVYSKTDVAALAIQSALHDQFEKPIKEIIRIETEQSSQERKLCTCTLSSTLEQVLEELSANRVRRAVIIDAEKHVLGIVSMSDILKFLLI